MAREHLVKLSERERELIEEVREVEFGTDSVPLGEAVEVACENYLGEMRLDAMQDDN